MARARGDLFDAVQRYPVMLLDCERIFGLLEDNTGLVWHAVYVDITPPPPPHVSDRGPFPFAATVLNRHPAKAMPTPRRKRAKAYRVIR